MNLLPPSRLILLDFSGTLTLGTLRYSQESFLEACLRSTGLDRFGIDTGSSYWEQVAVPLWPASAISPVGLAPLLENLLEELAHPGVAPAGAAGTSARQFVGEFFSSMQIEPGWKPILQELVRAPGAVVVIATDHYAEATAHILAQLEGGGVPAMPANRPPIPGTALVANSADLGALKAQPEFWERLRAALGLPEDAGALAGAAIIDDFGANEASKDYYGAPAQVAARREKTIALISHAFGVETQAFSFDLQRDGDPAGLPSRFEARLAEAQEFLLNFLRPAQSTLT